jgi:tape measure domain-containing protein
MTVEVERLIVTLEARLDGYNKGLTQAQSETNKRLAAMEARYQQMASRLKASASTAALSIGGAFAGLATYLSVDKVIEYADAWTRVRRALEQNEKIFGTQLKSAEELNAIASATRQDLEAVSKLYIRTSNAVQEMGRSNDDAALAVESFAKALVIGQASANEQRGAIEQFSQALQKGKLDGDEFRTIMETAGVVQEALAKSFNVSRGSLLGMARAGKLTGKDIVSALIKIKPVIDEAFKSAPTTVGEGLTVLNNAITQYVGKLNEATRATNGVGAALKYAALNMDTVAGVALTLAAALLAPFGGSALANIGAFAARLATLPGFILGSVVAMETLGGQVKLNLADFATFSEGGLDFGAAFGLSMNDAGQSATTLRDQFNGLVSLLSDDMLSAINVLTNALTGQDVTWQDVAAAALVSIGAIVGGVKGLYHLTVASFDAIPLIIEASFKGLINKIVSAMQAVIDAVTDGINTVIAVANKLPKVELDFVVAPKLDGFDNQAVAQLEDLSRKITDQLKKDFDLSGLARDVNQRAKFSALNRVISGYGIEKLDRGAPAKPRKPLEEKDKRNEYDREVAGIRKKIEAQRAEIATIGQSIFAQEKAKAVAELTFAAQQAAAKEGRVYAGEHRAEIDKLADSYAKLQVEATFLANIQSQREANQAIRDEIALVGLYGEALAVAKTKQDLLNEAKRLGIALTPEMERQIAVIAEENGQLEQQRQIINDIRDQSQEALKGFISDMREGKSATEALANALNRVADKLIDMAVNGLVEGALGGLINGGVGPSSGVASLFGFANGGIAANGRPVSIPKFARGGVSRSAAIFGEAGPEAAVPLPDGRRIPVDLRLPDTPKAVAPASAAPSLTLNLSIDARGASPETAGRLKAELVPTIQSVVRSEVNQMFDRSPRFAKAGI